MDPIKLEIQETHLECDFDHLLHIKPEVDIFFVHPFDSQMMAAMCDHFQHCLRNLASFFCSAIQCLCDNHAENHILEILRGSIVVYRGWYNVATEKFPPNFVLPQEFKFYPSDLAISSSEVEEIRKELSRHLMLFNNMVKTDEPAWSKKVVLYYKSLDACLKRSVKELQSVERKPCNYVTKMCPLHIVMEGNRIDPVANSILNVFPDVGNNILFTQN